MKFTLDELSSDSKRDSSFSIPSLGGDKDSSFSIPALREQKTSKYDVTELEGLIEYARAVGEEEKAKEAETPPKLSLLERLGRGLSSFEIGNAFYQHKYNDASFGETYWNDIKSGLKSAFTGQEARTSDKKTWKDTLMKEGWSDRQGKLDAVDVVGLAADIIADPTTIFGGAIAKVGGRGLSLTGKIAKRTPFVRSGVKAVEKLFIPDSKILNTLGELGQQYVDNKYLMHKGVRASANRFQDNIIGMTKKVKKARGKRGVEEAGRVIGETIEKGFKTTGDDFLDEIMINLKKNQDTFARELKEKGIITKELPNYMHHMLTDEAAAAIREGGADFGMFLKPLRDPKGKHRDVLGLVDETGKEIAPQNIKRAGFTRLDKLTKKQYNKLLKEKGSKLVNANDFVKDGKLYKVRNTSVREINEQVRKKWGLKDGLFEENAFKAFSRSGLRSIKDIRTKDFLQSTKRNFGVKAGEKGLTHGSVDSAGIKWVRADKVSDDFADTLVPEPILEDLQKITDIAVNDEATKEFLNFYDSVQRFWKGSVTGWFPAFHTRNALGGIFNNFIGGLTNPKKYSDAIMITKGAKGVRKFSKDIEVGGKVYKAGDEVPYSDIKRLAQDYGVLGQSGIIDFMEELDKGVITGAKDFLNKYPRTAMETVENGVRLPMFLDGLDKGMDPLQAAKRVMKYNFDYSPEGLTTFEKSVMKRVMPFYRFTRANVPLQIEQMIMQPGKYGGLFKLQRSLNLSPEGEEGDESRYLPEWLRERFTIKGQGGYWSGLGLPLEEATEKLSKPLRGFGISLSPLIKIPTEQLTGYNIFKERKIDEDTYGKHYEPMPEFLKDWMNFKKHTSEDGTKFYTVNPRKKYWLEAIGSRGWSTALRVAAGTEGGDHKNLISLLHTIRKYDYTPEEIKRWSVREDREKLQKELQRIGELSEFRTFYIND